MKRKLFTGVILLSFVTLTFMSCEKIKDLTDVPIETTLSADIPVTSASATESSLKSGSVMTYSFEGSAVIDPTSDEDIEKYWSKIRSWEVKKFNGIVRTISQAATLIQGDLTVKDDETKETLFTKKVENISLSNGSDVMEVVGGDWKKVIDAFDAGHSVEVSIKGDVNRPGVVIVFTLGFDVIVVANPLN